MNTRRIMAAVVVVAGVSAGCTRTVAYKESSPAPLVVNESDAAHGSRPLNSGDDVALVYDKSLGVYAVSGYKDCYYSAGQYFRYVAGCWEWSMDVASGWKIVAKTSDVPPGLRAKHGNGKNTGKAKGDDKN